MITHNLAQTAAERRRHSEIARTQHPGPCHPNPSLTIFQNRTDPTGDVGLEMIVLPTQKAGVRADPEGSVRRTQQGHDRSVEYACVGSGRPAQKTNAVKSHQSRIDPDPDV